MALKRKTRIAIFVVMIALAAVSYHFIDVKAAPIDEVSENPTALMFEKVSYVQSVRVIRLIGQQTVRGQKEFQYEVEAINASHHSKGDLKGKFSVSSTFQLSRAESVDRIEKMQTYDLYLSRNYARGWYAVQGIGHFSI